MNILMGNWTWRRVAGEWTYIDNLQSLYKKQGHHIIPFSMKHPANTYSGGYEQYFIENIDYVALSRQKNIPNSIKAISKSIYSNESKRNLERLLSQHHVDAAHLHDVHHYLTPSIFPVLAKHRIPILWTLHDYTLLCPEGTFLSNGSICEKCKDSNFYPCVRRKCKKNSLLPSILAATENWVHRRIDAFRYVDYFLCPSRFLYNKFREFNFYPDKLILSNLCCEIDPLPEKILREPYIIYTGRLAKVKGLFTLLKAMTGIPVKLLIAGDGPEASAISQWIAMHNVANVELIGFQPKEALYRLVRNALCLICPSEWYENFPYAVIEAMLLKTPVIAASIGGIPELVIHEQTGLLFEARDVQALHSLIVRLLSDTALQQTLAANAYIRTSTVVNYEQHYKVLEEVYRRVGRAL